MLGGRREEKGTRLPDVKKKMLAVNSVSETDGIERYAQQAKTATSIHVHSLWLKILKKYKICVILCMFLL